MTEQERDVRMLTVKQPHAWAIVNGHKDVENRTWKFPLPPGTRVAVLAGKKWAPPLRVDVGAPENRSEYVAGAVIGFVTVVDDHEDCGGGCSPWAVTGHRHWRLADAAVLDRPVPQRGALWLQRAEGQVRAQLVAELDREHR